MNTQSLERQGFKVIDVPVKKYNKVLTREQLKAKFKRLYGKEPTDREFSQYCKNHKIFVF